MVTSFENRLHPVGPVLAGPVFHPFTKAKEVLQFYRDFASATHEQLTTYAVPMTAPDGAKVIAMRDWIATHFSYVPGVSTSNTGALESYVLRQGVCRDYAHMLITLARAAGVPARFVSGYAPGVTPPDFHAVAEVFLDGAWYMADATGMATGADMAKIGVGRDAADTSFLTHYAACSLNRQEISVTRL